MSETLDLIRQVLKRAERINDEFIAGLARSMMCAQSADAPYLARALEYAYHQLNLAGWTDSQQEIDLIIQRKGKAHGLDVNMKKDHIKIENCEDRRLYELRSRNLACGVYSSASRCFLGIRSKFGREYVTSEYHWDDGPPYGTARPMTDTGIDLPADIELRAVLGTVDEATGRHIEFDGSAWKWIDVMTGEYVEATRPTALMNESLFTWLKYYVRNTERQGPVR